MIFMEYLEHSMKICTQASSSFYQNLESSRAHIVSETTASPFSGSLLQQEKYTGKGKDWTTQWVIQERNLPFKETSYVHNRRVQIFMVLPVFVQNIVYWKKCLSSIKYQFLAVNSDTFNIFLSPWNFNINRKVWKSRHRYGFRLTKIS